MSSSLFGSQSPVAGHLLPLHGLPGEIADLRRDVEAAFQKLETQGLPVAHMVDIGRALQGTDRFPVGGSSALLSALLAYVQANLTPTTPARDTAYRRVSLATSTLATTDKIVELLRGANHDMTLPPAASAAGLEFLIQIFDTGAYSLTLHLDAGDTGSKIYFQGNTPVAGANLTVMGADSGLRPGFLIYSNGTDWVLT